LGKSISEVVQSDLLQDKTSVEEQLRQEQGRSDSGHQLMPDSLRTRNLWRCSVFCALCKSVYLLL